MSVAKKFVEQRKHKRFSVSNGAFVALRPDYLKVGQVKNIGMDGLAFTYLMDDGKSPDQSLALDIFLADQTFRLEGVPFTIISDFHIDGIPFSSVKTRQMDVQFGDLTPYQKAHLEYFIQNHTNGEEKKRGQVYG
jgi:hypothetical protein